MRLLTFAVLIGALVGLTATARAQNILFDFDGLPAHSGLPTDVTVGGLTAHLTGTAASFSVQNANTLGFTPTGFAGNCIYPDSVFAADLQIQFSEPLSDFSIMYAPEEYACDSSATMRVTAYYKGNLVGTSTTIADPPGTWPTGTLRFTSNLPFNYVVIHYDKAPVTGGDWGPVFLADNMRVTLSNALLAVDDTYWVTSGKTLTVVASSGVMSNDLGATGATVALVNSPSHGSVSLLASGAFTYTPAKGFVGADTFTYTDSLAGQASNSATVTINIQPILTAFTISPTSILGGNNVQGIVTLSAKAPTGGTSVTLTDNSASITVPVQVVVPSGASSANFSIATSPVASKTIGSITASLNSVQKVSSLTLYPVASLTSMTSKVTTLVGGTQTTGMITLSASVAFGSEVVFLTSGSPSISVPASVTIPTGKSSATFTISTSAVSTTSTGALSATLFGVKQTETITITTPLITSLKVAPVTIRGGASATCTLILSGKAGPQGDVIGLSANSAVVGIPATITVPAGATTVSFKLTSLTVASKTSVKLTATLGSSSGSAIITVTH